MAITRYYDESKNPEGAALPGVPLRDLEDEEFASYPAWLQDSIDAWAAYRKTKPRADTTTKLPPVSNTERTAPGTGRKMTAIEAPADGSLSDELTSDDAEKE
jgi:hypothetical protein